MQRGYNQYCPISKASEILATRWTPLILRELMGGASSFNDIHRGVPLISRAVLVARLRELEHEGILERRPRAAGPGHEYHLTRAGEALRSVISGFAHWGLVHARDRVKPGDLDPTVLLWGFRKRALLDRLPERRVVVRFEFSGVPASRPRYRILWLILERAGADVCVKDPGHAVDLVFRGNIADFVNVYLGHALWHDLEGKAITVEGDRDLARKAPSWLRLDQVVGRDFPAVRGGPLMSERASSP
jgi:DNA-binding HxlR family transcriptional regulator